MDPIKCTCGAVPKFKKDNSGEDMEKVFFQCEACGKHSEPSIFGWKGEDREEAAADKWNDMIIEELRQTPIKPGQVWRKKGPYDWLRIEHIEDPTYPSEYSYDGGLPGVGITSFPPQLKGIQLKGGTRYFLAGSKSESWEDQVRRNRFPLRDENEANLM